MSSLRSFLDQQPLLAGGIVALLLTVALVGILRHFSQSSTPMQTGYQMWAFDEQTGSYHPHPHDEDVIRAHVFACGSCDREEDRFLGFLSQGERGTRSVDDPTWHPPLSDGEKHISQQPGARCRALGKPLVVCHAPTK